MKKGRQAVPLPLRLENPPAAGSPPPSASSPAPSSAPSSASSAPLSTPTQSLTPSASSNWSRSGETSAAAQQQQQQQHHHHINQNTHHQTVLAHQSPASSSSVSLSPRWFPRKSSRSPRNASFDQYGSSHSLALSVHHHQPLSSAAAAADGSFLPPSSLPPLPSPSSPPPAPLSSPPLPSTSASTSTATPALVRQPDHDGLPAVFSLSQHPVHLLSQYDQQQPAKLRKQPPPHIQQQLYAAQQQQQQQEHGQPSPVDDDANTLPAATTTTTTTTSSSSSSSTANLHRHTAYPTISTTFYGSSSSPSSTLPRTLAPSSSSSSPAESAAAAPLPSPVPSPSSFPRASSPAPSPLASRPSHPYTPHHQHSLSSPQPLLHDRDRDDAGATLLSGRRIRSGFFSFGRDRDKPGKTTAASLVYGYGSMSSRSEINMSRGEFAGRIAWRRVALSLSCVARGVVCCRGDARRGRCFRRISHA
jgi:hypothetical protein